ncbi:MAG TPA: maleylpyruvate isomerase N-terminal domain-containing protein [Actinocrinis sp.]|nr:maleylpyruvate isomerase N-terminal domain-containing protein [Actinocrinis sp.]
MPEPIEVLKAAYGAFADVVRGMTDEVSWLPTDCVGWMVRDLVFHTLADAQRALVALHTPAARAADRDAVSYWTDWQPDPAALAAASGRRYVRVGASMFVHVEQLRELYLETAGAVVHAAAATPGDLLVATQGHVLTAGDLLRTLAVEVTIHHLDLVRSLPGGQPGPSRLGLGQVRRTLDGLLGRPTPVTAWDDATYARKATGRSALTGQERNLLGEDADRLPLFA